MRWFLLFILGFFVLFLKEVKGEMDQIQQNIQIESLNLADNKADVLDKELEAVQADAIRRGLFTSGFFYKRITMKYVEINKKFIFDIFEFSKNSFNNYQELLTEDDWRFLRNHCLTWLRNSIDERAITGVLKSYGKKDALTDSDFDHFWKLAEDERNKIESELIRRLKILRNEHDLHREKRLRGEKEVDFKEPRSLWECIKLANKIIIPKIALFTSLGLFFLYFLYVGFLYIWPKI